MDIIKNLSWRYATKEFDSLKKVSSTDLQKIQKAVQLSASSYGLQAYKVLVIENPEIRKKLRTASWGQPQITECSHLFVFCSYTAIGPKVLDDFMQLNADIKGLKLDDLKGFGDMINGSLSQRTPEEIKAWTAKQTYIALSTLLAASAELKIDACPMEGFDAAEYNKILGLNEKGLTASVIAAVGYRSSTDQHQFHPKVRKPLELLFELV